MAKENSEIIQATGYFNGSKTKGNYDIELNFKFTEAELANVLQFLAGIGSELNILAIVNEQKVKLGSFNLYNLSVDRDANSKVRFKSNMDRCYMNNFTALMFDEEVPITLKAKVIKTNS